MEVCRGTVGRSRVNETPEQCDVEAVEVELEANQH